MTAVGKRCQARSLEPNGPLDHGANAFGFPQAEFEDLPKRYPELARILHFGVAYNAFSLLQNYHQGSKDQQWCLLELGGVAILHFGLPLKRGGFIEGSAAELWGIVRGQE